MQTSFQCFQDFTSVYNLQIFSFVPSLRRWTKCFESPRLGLSTLLFVCFGTHFHQINIQSTNYARIEASYLCSKKETWDTIYPTCLPNADISILSPLSFSSPHATTHKVAFAGIYAPHPASNMEQHPKVCIYILVSKQENLKKALSTKRAQIKEHHNSREDDGSFCLSLCMFSIMFSAGI